MPRINDLADDFAERFGIENTRTRGIVRHLREAGMVTTGARGVNAPHATPLDAARLLIACMLIWRPANRIALDVSEFGKWETRNEGRAREALRFTALEDALASVLDWGGQQTRADHLSEKIAFPSSLQLAPWVGHAVLTFDRIDASANPLCEKEEYLFTSLDILDCPDGDEADTHFRDKHSKGFELVPTVRFYNFLAIGQVIAGKQPLGFCL